MASDFVLRQISDELLPLEQRVDGKARDGVSAIRHLLNEGKMEDAYKRFENTQIADGADATLLSTKAAELKSYLDYCNWCASRISFFDPSP